MSTPATCPLVVGDEEFDFDRRVSERVLGQELVSGFVSAVSGYPAHDQLVWADSEHYGTNLQAAGRILDVLRRTGRYCCIRLESDYEYQWTVEIWRDDSLLKPDTSGLFGWLLRRFSLSREHHMIIQEHDRVLPKAICKAALALCDHPEEGRYVDRARA